MSIAENSNSNYARAVEELRCSDCSRLLTKLIFSVFVPPWVVEVAQERGLKPVYEDGYVQLWSLGIEVKVGHETKCQRCKTMDNKVHAF